MMCSVVSVLRLQNAQNRVGIALGKRGGSWGLGVGEAYRVPWNHCRIRRSYNSICELRLCIYIRTYVDHIKWRAGTHLAPSLIQIYPLHSARSHLQRHFHFHLHFQFGSVRFRFNIR